SRGGGTDGVRPGRDARSGLAVLGRLWGGGGDDSGPEPAHALVPGGAAGLCQWTADGWGGGRSGPGRGRVSLAARTGSARAQRLAAGLARDRGHAPLCGARCGAVVTRVAAGEGPLRGRQNGGEDVADLASLPGVSALWVLVSLLRGVLWH